MALIIIIILLSVITKRFFYFFKMIFLFNFIFCFNFLYCSLWFSPTKNSLRKKKTRQSGASDSQQLNVIICKSWNKYETNWHETTACMVFAHTQGKNMFRGSFSISFDCTSHCFHHTGRAHSHTHTKASSLPPFLTYFVTALTCRRAKKRQTTFFWWNS